MVSAEHIAPAAGEWLQDALGGLRSLPLSFMLLFVVIFILSSAILLYLVIFIAASIPRPAQNSEKTYVTILHDGSVSEAKQLPCWHDNHLALKEMARKKQIPADEAYQIDSPEVFMSVVVPAYNEEERLSGMLEEAVDFLQAAYPLQNDKYTNKRPVGNGSANGHTGASSVQGWEILIISDGSTDKTVETALSLARSWQVSRKVAFGEGSIRVISLEKNRGKGGAVTHGMRHARGAYVVFADADGASKFSDLASLVKGCQEIEDKDGRAVGIGSRAHLVGSEAVVKRSFLRNTLMHSFHLLLRLMTPAATSKIKDTQCGFKLFSRPALPYIIPYMHSEGWIFDVEMLMLAESAGIPMKEVAIGWKEVKGSKLNVIWDSLGMAWGLFVLRAAWATGVYKVD
ncbi:dolichyl-phosphate beta-glucosyltransferase [Elasticomyces elasticus]|nr:dolichyl-phosphate beta-glucosyltransferase [Elasticomyces elasticus]KAK4987881.1 dolichyl-phosphate beta-glucosyltransferase [Elasticomyces elasticus]